MVWTEQGGGSTGRAVYLTFDDGPHPDYTPRVLDVLERHDARATFFQVGGEASAHPELTRLVDEAGHVVGNHTWSHPDLSQVDDERTFEELTRTNRVLADILGEPPTLFRPPYGRTAEATENAVVRAGLRTVLWDVDPLDWDEPGVGEIVARVLAGLEPGAVVLLHDGGGDRSQTVSATEEILRTLGECGFRFLALS